MEQIISHGLENVVVAETDLSLVDGLKGHLIYRGYWARDLAVNHTFEEVAHLIWYGHLPNEEELKTLKNKLSSQRELPQYVKDALDNLPKGTDMMAVLRTGVSLLELEGELWPPSLEQVITLASKMPTIIAHRYAREHGREPVAPRQDLDHTANYLYMLKGVEPNPAHVRAMDAYLVLTEEHGLNASTFTARVIASTRSDLISCITGAIGSLKGPLHGGAPSEVTEMIDAIGTKENVEPWLRNRLASGERLMGFGHRVYRVMDPRAVALNEIASKLTADDPWFELAVEIAEVGTRLLKEHKPDRPLNVNVDFYAAAVMRAIGLEDYLFTPTFAASRIVGWGAHVLEASKMRIIRPQSIYTGTMPE
jgi:citrate synthase